MMECRKPTEAEGNMEKAEEILRVAGQGRQGPPCRDRRRRGRQFHRRQRRRAGRSQTAKPTSSPRTTCSWHSATCRRTGRRETIRLTSPPSANCRCRWKASARPSRKSARHLIGKIGENMSIRRLSVRRRRQPGGLLHGAHRRDGRARRRPGRRRDAAMHIAAMKPVALSSADVPADLDRQGAFGRRAEGRRSGQAWPTSSPRWSKAFAEVPAKSRCYDQVFVKAADGKQTVGAYLKSANTAVKWLHPVRGRRRHREEGRRLRLLKSLLRLQPPRRLIETLEAKEAGPCRCRRKFGRPFAVGRCRGSPKIHRIWDSLPMPAYKRILLKLSGEALMGDDAFGINRATIERIVGEVAEVTRLGVEVAVVIGGGNIFRGVAGGSVGMDRHRRLHGHAGHGHERSRSATHSARPASPPASCRRSRSTRWSSPYVPGKALQHPRGQGRRVRRRHRQPFFTTDTAAEAARRRDRCPDRAQGDQGRRHLQRRSQEGPERNAVMAPSASTRRSQVSSR